MTAHLSLRRATDSDAALLCQLNRAVQELHAAREPALFKPFEDEAAALDHFRDLLAHPRNHVELAFAHEQPAGYAWWSLERRAETLFRYAQTRLYVHHIAVAPAQRRCGVGRALLEAAVTAASARQAAGVVLDTWGFNVEAQAFFRALGFEVARIELYRALS